LPQTRNLNSGEQSFAGNHDSEAASKRPAGSSRRRLKVLHIITRMIQGGAQENTLLTVIGQSRNPRLEVSLLTGRETGPEGELITLARKSGVDLHFSDSLQRAINPLRDVRAFWECYRFIKEGRFDVVHTHSSKAGIVGRIAAKAAGTPHVVHSLHALVFHENQSFLVNRFYVLLKKLAARFTDYFISVCEATKQGALKYGIGADKPHRVIFSGMDLEPFQSVQKNLSKEEARREFGIPLEAIVIGKVARLFPLKGHKYFFDAAEKLAATHANVHFLLVGNGILREQLESRARSSGIDSRTHFTGLLDRNLVPRAMRAMDILVHSSVREGIARVIPQALATGIPVVSFRMDGAPEVIRHGETGFLAEPFSSEDLLFWLERLVDSEHLRKEMAHKGETFVKERFTVERMVRDINEVYSSLTGVPLR